MSNSRIVLASRSPRRAALLREAGFDFIQQPADDDVEPALPTAARDPQRLAIQLAHHKADHVARRLASVSAVVLGADTIVIAPDGRLLGQPRDRDDAAAMLSALLGHTHHVITGVVLIDPAGERPAETFADDAAVHLDPLDPYVLQAYLDSSQWQGKAGGYNFAELEHRWPIRVEPGSDPTTVVGLPMIELTTRLARWHITPRCDGAHETG